MLSAKKILLAIKSTNTNTTAICHSKLNFLFSCQNCKSNGQQFKQTNTNTTTDCVIIEMTQSKRVKHKLDFEFLNFLGIDEKSAPQFECEYFNQM